MKKYLVVVFLLLVTYISGIAQPPSPPGDPGGGVNPDVPITGIEILIGLGGALGARKMLSKRRK